MFSSDFTPEEKQKLNIAGNIVSSFFPHLAGIFNQLDIRFDERIGTAAVTPTGKLLLDRDFFRGLNPGLETAFILAHEMLHLAEMIFERAESFSDQEAVNIAHDVLINTRLCKKMKLDTPSCNGLDICFLYYHYHISCSSDHLPSLEELVKQIIKKKNAYSRYRPHVWQLPVPEAREQALIDGIQRRADQFSNNPFADLFPSDEPEQNTGTPAPALAPGQEKITLDMIGRALEKQLFPDEDAKEQEVRRENLKKVCHDSVLQDILLTHASGPHSRGSGTGNCSQEIELVKSCYVPPWQMAVQSWFDNAVCSRRSWARASRRGAWRQDVILPGREEVDLILHIVLDTSGSMTGYIPFLLGQIGSFARAVGIGQVHILQCDMTVTQDEYIDISLLHKYKVEGFGGSDMSPAMLKLAEDPEVTSVLVITDGMIDYPPEEDIPFDVLWCIPDDYAAWASSFLYGKTVYVPVQNQN